MVLFGMLSEAKHPRGHMTNIDFTAAQYSVEVVATVVFALTGVLEAARKRLDVVGVSVAACLAAFGGGTLRDILLDRRQILYPQRSMARRHWSSYNKILRAQGAIPTCR